VEPHEKSGYRVIAVRPHGGRVASYQLFITGFERNEQAWDRPVDVQPAAYW
jgi:hypothetical protein